MLKTYHFYIDLNKSKITILTEQNISHKQIEKMKKQ